MYQVKINAKKKEAVERILDTIRTTDHYIFTDYCGLNVTEITELRSKLIAHNTSFRVVKNAYAQLAFSTEGFKDLSHILVGPTALAYTQGDAVTTLKELFEFRKVSKLEIKGGVVDGVFYTPEDLEGISKLPSMPQLLSKLIGTVQAPVQSCAGTLVSVIQKLMRTLTAVGEAKE